MVDVEGDDMASEVGHVGVQNEALDLARAMRLISIDFIAIAEWLVRVRDGRAVSESEQRARLSH